MLVVCSFEGLKVCSATERHFNALFMRNDLQHCIVSPSRTLTGLLVTGSTVMLGEEAEELFSDYSAPCGLYTVGACR